MDIVAKKKLSYHEYLCLLDKTKAVVDFQQPTQCGLTMRTIESLSRGVKVVTSNNHIRDHIDIPQSMYFVLDEGYSTNKLVEFISNGNTIPLPTRYSLSSFLKEILG